MNNYFKKQDGGIAAAMAICILVLSCLVGIAVDYTTMISNKSKMQDALDSTVLAAVMNIDIAKNRTIRKAGGMKTANKFYTEQVQLGHIADFSRRVDTNSATVTASAYYEMPTIFGSLIGKNNLPIKVTATATSPLSLSGFRVRLKSASGWWGKTARVVGTKSGIKTELVNAVYSSAGPVGPTSFTLSDSNWINISDYDDVYIELKIHDNAFEFDKWCGLPGCPSKLFTSNTPANSDRFYINGRQQPRNVIVDFKDTINCGQRVEHGWEDGGSHSPDFHYYVEGKCEFINPASVHLSR